MCYDNTIKGRGGSTLIIKLHPLAKTAIEARRAIQRLEVFMEIHPEDEHVKSGAVSVIIENLKEVRSHIPAPLRDVDLEK